MSWRCRASSRPPTRWVRTERCIGFNKRINEVGPRTQENGYDVVQGLIGFRGDFQIGERDFGWDVFGSWGRAEGTSLQGGNVSRARLQAALNDPTVYASRGCATFDPFGPGNLAPACANAIAINATNILESRADELRRQPDRRRVQPARRHGEVRRGRRVSREHRGVPPG